MTIPESQLETWAHKGSDALASSTYASVRNAIDSHEWPLGGSYQVYLQGSYKNATNVRSDSDVDVVVELRSTFSVDTSHLNSSADAALRNDYPVASYDWHSFRADVLAALVDYFGGSQIEERKKCIKVAAKPGRLAADVLVALSRRLYLSYGDGDEEFVEGVTFYVASESRWAENYPQLHHKNGVLKNAETDEWYKPAIRMFKNARSAALRRVYLYEGNAPSYFIECLMFNANNQLFGESLQDTYKEVVNWLGRTDMSKFVCQNDLISLFGPSPEQWQLDMAERLVDAYIHLWENWS